MGVVAGRREGGHLLAEWGVRRGWGWTEGPGGVISPGDRALGAFESPEAVGVAGWGEGEVTRLAWGGGAAGGGGAVGEGVVREDGGVQLLNCRSVDLCRRRGWGGRWRRLRGGVVELEGVCGRCVWH